MAFLRRFFSVEIPNVQGIILGAQVNVYIKVYERRIQNRVKHLRWNFLPKILTDEICVKNVRIELFMKTVNG